MSDLRDRIAAVQSAHQAPGNACLCGWEYDPLVDDSHFDHVADMVIEALGMRQMIMDTDDGEGPKRFHCYVTRWERVA